MKKSMLMVMAMVMLLTCVAILSAQEMDWLWAKSVGGLDDDFGQGIAVDGEGNSYVTGAFRGTATFGTTTLTSSGDSDIYVAKLDAGGNWLWVKKVGGSGTDAGSGIAIDSEGNSYVTGWIGGTVSFGNTWLSSRGSNDIFIAKADKDGNWLWAKRAGGSSDDTGRSIAVDSEGNIYVTGYFYSSTATFGSITLTSSEGADIFIAKADKNGNWLWVKQAGGSSGDFGEGITVDNEGNSYMTGRFGGTATFGSTTLTGSGGEEICIAKIDKDGNWLWVKQAGGEWHDKGTSIAVDGEGNNYVTGRFMGTATFGSITIKSSDSADIFITKVDKDGNWLWAKSAGGLSDDTGQSIAVDIAGNSYVTGWFGGTVSFGSTTLSSRGGKDIFIAKADKDGNWLWAKKAGGSPQNGSHSQGIAVDIAGNCYVTGYFDGTATFSGTTIESNGEKDIFIAKFYGDGFNLVSPNGGEVWKSGETKTVYWHTDYSFMANVQLSYDNGESWTLLTENPINSLLKQYSFTVPYVESDQCLIRVDWIENSAHYIQSQECFTINSSASASQLALNTTSLTKVRASAIYPIKWTSEEIDKVNLDYSINSGVTWINITESIPAQDGSYDWVIPHNPSTNCHIRISDADKPTLYDITEELFTIAVLDLTVPNGSEVWEAQTEKAIEWNSSNIGKVNLEYSLNDGATWSTIQNNVLADYEKIVWSIPKISSDYCRVRITDTEDQSVFDMNDELFKIRPQIIIESPKPDDLVLAMSIVKIEWDAIDEVQNVIIDYSYDGGDNWHPVQHSPITASTGYYDWLVPDTPSNDCLIKISRTDMSEVYTVSSAPFSIVTEPVAPTANFKAEITSDSIPFTVQFIDESTPGIGTIESWLWEFGDGVTSDEQNPAHIYEETGLYTVKLTVTNTHNLSHSITKDDIIDVHFVNIDEELHLPLKTELHCNYPNPFNPETKLSFSLAEPGVVKIDVYNLQGQLIKTLTNTHYPSGHYSVVWNGSDSANKQVGSGIYFYRMKTKDYVETRRMSLIK